MSFPHTLRCTMKMRACGLFWHKAVISLKFPSTLTPGQSQQGMLVVARPKVFGGKMEIPLKHSTTSLVSVSGKEARRYQLQVRYGSRLQTITLRAPTSAIYETWWAALDNALTTPNFVVLPDIDASAHQVTIAPVLPTRCNAARPKHTATLETVDEVGYESESIDGIPMLEAGGPSSPTETDILASWRTWASLDYFATPPSITGPLSSNDAHEAEVTREAEDDNTNVNTKVDSSTSDRNSVYSDISEFWSRPSEWEDEILDDVSAPTTNFVIEQNPITLQPQDDDDKWLDEIALYAFRQKIGASRKSERRPSRRITGRMHPLLMYALF